jgi:all-trans-retinol 13,14-reductase
MSEISVGRSYRQHPVDETYDAIVVGSGIGGLSAAALLARHGRRKVLVLERHYTAGGFTHVFRRPGFEWDVGVHYVGEMGNPKSEPYALFDHLTDGNLQWAQMPDVYDRFVFGDATYDIPSGRERLEAALLDHFPNEGRAIARYLDLVLELCRASGPYFIPGVLPKFLGACVGPWMRRRFLRYARRTTESVLAEITNDVRLRSVLACQWGDYGLPPPQSSFGIHALVVGSYIDGASYPVGGSSRIAATIAPAIEAIGGRIATSAQVEQILLDSKGRAAGVRMADGREIRSRVVISDAGATTTYRRLLPADAPGMARVEGTLRTLAPSAAHVCLYLGLRKSDAEMGLRGTNVWMFGDRDHAAGLARFEADRSQPMPVVFVSFPSAKDPSFAERYPGRSTIEAVTLVPYDWFSKWEKEPWRKRGAEYDALKKDIEQRLLAAVEKCVPGVRKHIAHCELSTPLSTRHFAGHERGEIYGLAATPTRFTTFLGPRTPIRGLYLTGADVVSLGVVGALYGGVLAASAIMNRNLLAKVKKLPRSGIAASGPIPVASARAA